MAGRRDLCRGAPRAVRSFCDVLYCTVLYVLRVQYVLGPVKNDDRSNIGQFIVLALVVERCKVQSESDIIL